MPTRNGVSATGRVTLRSLLSGLRSSEGDPIDERQALANCKPVSKAILSITPMSTNTCAEEHHGQLLRTHAAGRGVTPAAHPRAPEHLEALPRLGVAGGGPQPA
jgi:hypothetical protein